MKQKYLLYIAVISALLMNCKKADPDTGNEIKAPSFADAKVPTVTTNPITSITTLTAATGGVTTANGGASVTDRGICLSTSPNPTIEHTKFGYTNVNGAGEFSTKITGLTASTKYYIRAFATNRAGTGYGNEIEFTTSSIGNATFSYTPMFIIGATLATVDMEVLTDGGDAITERGVCWSTNVAPTTNDNKLKHGNNGLGKFRMMMKNLSERTTYHARAYAINAKGISYSPDITFKTIGRGRITYTFNKSNTPTAEMTAAYARLQVAIDSAVWYLENYTSATKHVYLNYVADVATADANNEGWMRFGSGSGFQNLRTMLHEMDHTLGTGTSTWWTGKIVGGKFQGAHTNELLNKIQKSSGAQLSGDSQHWWPYGLNQNSEVTSSWDYVYNCILVEAMRKDGLTQYSGPYTP